MTDYRQTTAVTTVVSAFLLWLGLFLGADMAWYSPSLLIPVGRYLMESAVKNAKKNPENDEVLNQEGVAAMLKIHVSHMYKLRHTPGFPPGKLIGATHRRWTRSSIQAWLNAQ